MEVTDYKFVLIDDRICSIDGVIIEDPSVVIDMYRGPKLFGGYSECLGYYKDNILIYEKRGFEDSLVVIRFKVNFTELSVKTICSLMNKMNYYPKFAKEFLSKGMDSVKDIEELHEEWGVFL